MDAISAEPLPVRPRLELFERRAEELVESRRADPPTLEQARLEVARTYGFASWATFAEHVGALAAGRAVFEVAVEAVVAGELNTLESVLDSDAALVRARSDRVHGATVLHYVAANGVENFRQKTLPNAVAIATALLRRGADPDATATMYGMAATTLMMLVSSTHPAAAGVQVALVDALIDHGAAVAGPAGDGERS